MIQSVGKRVSLLGLFCVATVTLTIELTTVSYASDREPVVQPITAPDIGKLTAAAEDGEVAAMERLAMALINLGQPAAGEEWLRRAANAGDARSIYNLGIYIAKQNSAESNELLRLSAALGFGPARSELALQALRLATTVDEKRRAFASMVSSTEVGERARLLDMATLATELNERPVLVEALVWTVVGLQDSASETQMRRLLEASKESLATKLTPHDQKLAFDRARVLIAAAPEKQTK